MTTTDMDRRHAVVRDQALALATEAICRLERRYHDKGRDMPPDIAALRWRLEETRARAQTIDESGGTS